MKTIMLVLLSLFFSSSLKAQYKQKDTLFFKYDTKYIDSHVEIPNHFYIKDGSGVSIGNFYFIEAKKLENQNVKSREICLKKFIRTSKFYDKNKNKKLDDYSLWEYFNNYIIVLIKNVGGKKEYIQVESGFEIE